MKSRSWWLGVGAVIGLILILTGWKVFAQPYTYQGSLIDPPAPVADFTLTDQKGQPFKLSDEKGKVVLIYFGYTNCPDECPTTMALFKQVKDELGSQADQARFMLITVDPERDTTKTLGTYLANFDPTFIGLSGSQPELAPVWKEFGVSVAKGPIDKVGNYAMEHSNFVYVIDKDGNLRLTYAYGVEKDAILSDVRHLIVE
jgi:protein SCO1